MVTPQRMRVASSASAGVVLLGTFLPWVRSGTRSRSSYLLLGLIDRLGFASGSAATVAIRLWPVMPMMLVGATFAAWMHHTRLAGLLGLVAAVYAGGLAIIVRTAPVPTLVGVDVVIVSGLALLASSLVLLLSQAPA